MNVFGPVVDRRDLQIPIYRRFLRPLGSELGFSQWTPPRLLLPGEEGPVVELPDGVEEDALHRPQPEPVALTPDLALPWRTVWDWACGEEPFFGIDRHGDWEVENRPQGRIRPTAGEFRRLGREAEGVALMFERAARLLLEASTKVENGGSRG